MISLALANGVTETTQYDSRLRRTCENGPDHSFNGNVYVTITEVREIEIEEYLDASGRSLFARWFDGLNPVAAAWASCRRRKGGKEHGKWH
jgi:hypothetical protein